MASKRMKSSIGADGGVIAFVCSDTDEGVIGIPASLRHQIVVGNDVDKFDPTKVVCVVWKSPGKAQVVEELFNRIKDSTGKPPAWFHSFFAGVDALGGFLNTIDTTRTRTTNGRGAFSSSLAEFSLAAMFHFNKQIPRLQKNFNEKRWDAFDMETIQGKTIGFLGWGSIPQATVKILQPLGVKKIIATKRNLVHSDNSGIRFVSKLECAAQADFIVNALPSTPETKDFANAEFFSAMKKTAIFINVGRGTTVDEDALADALQEHRIAGAALDVFKKEPLSPEHRFYRTPNLLLSNHNADHTVDYIALGWKVFEENYQLFLNDFQPVDDDNNKDHFFKPTDFDPKTGY